MARLLPFLILAVLAATLWLAWPAPRVEPTSGGPAAVLEPPLRPRAADEELAPDEPEPGSAALDARRSWLGKNEAGLAALREERYAEAVALLEECVEAEPAEPILRRNLAEALVRWAVFLHDVERDYPPAIAHLERVLVLAPDREDIDALRRTLERWKREAAVEEGFWTDGSPYFELVYDADRVDLRGGVQAMLDELHAAYGDLRDWFVLDPIIDLGRPKFRVVLYDAQEFDALTGLGHWAGGVFDGVLRLRVDDLARGLSWKTTVRHELVHAFVREVGGRNVPSWLNEGLAQLFDQGVRAPTAARLPHPRALWRQRLEDGQHLFTLDELQKSLATWTETAEISAGYAQSLLLTSHLLSEYGEHTVRQLLAATREGLGFAEAFQRESGVDARYLLEDLEASLRR